MRIDPVTITAPQTILAPARPDPSAPRSPNRGAARGGLAVAAVLGLGLAGDPAWASQRSSHVLTAAFPSEGPQGGEVLPEAGVHLASAQVAPPATGTGSGVEPTTASANPVSAQASPSPAPGAAATPAATSTTAPADAKPADAQPANGKPSEGKAPSGADGIVVEGWRGPPPQDPMMGANLKSYQAVESVDKAVIGPVAMGYKHAVPNPLREGIHHAIYNLREPTNFAGFVLEHKFGKAAETLGRLVINTTIGLGGFIDVAKRKPFHLPYRPNGLADALGFYGVKPGPYMFLPIIGPTTVRDLIGTTVDRTALAFIPGTPLKGPIYGVTMLVVNGIDDRVHIDDQVRRLRAEPDPYAAMRQFYLHRRQAEIDALHGRGEAPETLENEEPVPPPAAQPAPATAAPGGPAPAPNVPAPKAQGSETQAPAVPVPNAPVPGVPAPNTPAPLPTPPANPAQP